MQSSLKLENNAMQIISMEAQKRNENIIMTVKVSWSLMYYLNWDKLVAWKSWEK